MASFNKKIISLVLISHSICSQPIVDIENLRRSDEIGFFGSAGLNLDSSRGNENRDDFNITLALAKNNESIESLLVFNKSERTKDSVTEDESTFGHARILWKLDQTFDLETYIQTTQNPFQSYKKRNLIGIGVRFKDIQEYKVGLSILKEKEETLNGVNKDTDRLNIYVHRTAKFNNEMSLNTSLFFQPSVNEPNEDYKASLLFSLNIPISKKFNIQIQFSESIDKDPPDLADESNQSFSTNFIYKL
jgi:putative salt-induced outer membrane protein YdiY|tara:strand:- start:830 stop:1570 length:741 start_codon:yes stop_codon:yes gene_type:complete